MKPCPNRFAHESYSGFTTLSFASALIALLLAASSLQAQTVITDGASFNDAINAQASSITLQPASGGTISTVANTTTGIAGTVTYSAPFAGVISFGTSISGNGNTLSGSNGATPLFIVSPNNETASGAVTSPITYAVSASDLTVTFGLTLVAREDREAEQDWAATRPSHPVQETPSPSARLPTMQRVLSLPWPTTAFTVSQAQASVREGQAREPP